ncbi:MAG: hypothetical protein SAJ12_17360 [Jaaginema sp. PMC 1079.18]|nr:hypothetical protein [Jaaginema sp. PMC 1080.18]MEC4852752.1 hypothetical protein [Jaaginema sp. PMC 1079.18]MEC4868327.1 hypothetical protein [Jaaginema sp. PMC 1078.18]
MKTPSIGAGGHGTTSEFGDLTGMTLAEVGLFLKSLGATVTLSQSKQYLTYKFNDKSSLTIRCSDGRVSRLRAPQYNIEGRNMNKGLRINKDGTLLQTRDSLGNFISNTHDTGEFILC